MGNLADTSWFQEQIENEEEEFAFTGEYDHSIDTIDPDEPQIPGPDPKTYGYNDVSEQDEFAEGGEYNGIPEMEGTMDELEYLIDGIVGDPEFLGGR